MKYLKLICLLFLFTCSSSTEDYHTIYLNNGYRVYFVDYEIHEDGILIKYPEGDKCYFNYDEILKMEMKDLKENETIKI